MNFMHSQRRTCWWLGGRLNTHHAGGDSGFTIIELLLVIVIAAVVSVSVLMIFSSLTGVFYSQQARMLSQDDVRKAVNEMARFIRAATSSADNPSSQSNAIATALPQDIEFFCDVDGDDVAEKVRYYLDGTTLKTQTAEPVWLTSPTPHWEYSAYDTQGIVVQEAVQNGSDPVFLYYHYVDGELELFAPTSAAERQEIVAVRISLKVNEDPQLAARDVILATDVQIRQRYEGGLE